jgi:hypothetical protein
MTTFKAADYRRMFLEKIGFPLIRANAIRFVSDIGDLCKAVNLRRVYEASLEWLAKQSESQHENQVSRLMV